MPQAVLVEKFRTGHPTIALHICGAVRKIRGLHTPSVFQFLTGESIVWIHRLWQCTGFLVPFTSVVRVAKRARLLPEDMEWRAEADHLKAHQIACAVGWSIRGRRTK